MVDVRVDNVSQMDQALNDAIETVEAAATRHQTGIMITPTGLGRYVVRAHPAVPFGLVRQQNN
jgi:hypothetical protein